ncbi:LysR family transcriptional regulator [Agromyces larvae]|uniref:LysR family transcriptional regulator n=1 Tax=Agromyces larvae TaxID=2929802 RepID=A0ABY4C3E9_9MICO|nr:LysR family transcriptional regulator [Agromyces larvae]UOE43300.1 LysR family transcriptional regulator [Agromyces larvae]
MELRELRYFAAVVEAGSLTAAAARLHMSQPPLSVAIAKLETELGVRLLVRSSRGVEPTSAGRYLLDASTRVLGEVDEIVATIRRSAGGASGTLTLAAVPVLMWHRIPSLVRAHAAVAPDIEIRLVDPPPWTALDLLAQRRVDLAAIMVADHGRFIARHRDAYDIVDWGDVPLVAALPPGSEASDRVALRDFDDQIVFLPQRTAAVPSLPELVDAAFLRHGIVPRDVRTVGTIQTIVPLIEAGVGRALLPDPDRASLGRFDLTVRPVHPDPGALRVLVLTGRGGSSDPAVRGLLDLIGAPGAPAASEPVADRV